MWKKVCIIVSAILILVIVLIIILYFTVFKPKEPKIISHPATIENIHVIFVPPLINVTLGVGVTIDNRNYGSFKFHNSTAYVGYRGNAVGEGPIEADEIPARGKHDMTTSVTIFADKIIGDDMFLSDFMNGVLNFTSASTLEGKVKVFKLFKAKATSYSTCNISLFFTIFEQHVESTCQSKLSF